MNRIHLCRMKRNIFSLLLAAALLLSGLPAVARGANIMKFSDELVAYIKTGEGFSEKAIQDGSGWYIGYGCLVDPADYPDGITEKEAEQLLRDYMQNFADYVNFNLVLPYELELTQSQFDALLGLSYALGPGWIVYKYRLFQYLTTGIENYTDHEIANAFASMCHVGTHVNTVALQRRIVEAKMFLYGDYTFYGYGLDVGWNWIILDAAGGEHEYGDVAVYKSGEMYRTLPNPTCEGKYFAGWYKTDGTMLLPTDIADCNLYLTARWSDTPVELPQMPEEDPEEESDERDESDTYTLFPDVPDHAWYTPYVEKLAAAGVVNGFEDGSFRPKKYVTWGQALKLVLLASGFQARDPLENEPYERPKHWASGYLDFAETEGYVPKGSVRDLEAPITRDELADLAAAALELTEQAPTYIYADSVRPSALMLFAQGIMEGSFNTEGKRVFLGSDKLRRSEVCAVVARIQDYVDRTWILFAGYRVPINYDLAFNRYDRAAFYRENGRTYYSDGTTQVRYGIDVSWHQGEIDWEKAVADGVSFAIIRCGYRGYTSGEIAEDSCFRANMEGALSCGIPVGVYFFSQATSVAEAKEELAFTLELIRGYPITLPVVYDWEPVTQASSRTRSPNWANVTDCMVTFCDGVAAAGYTPMCYYNPSMAYLKLDLTRLQKYPTWLAHYVDATNFRYDFQMWQYGSSGSVDGIEGRVDMDILFGNI